MLVDRIIVMPANRDFIIELVGAITHTIRHSVGSEGLTKEPYLSSIKVTMVAGEGYHLYRTVVIWPK
jgi:hypothetical protein